MLKIKTKLGASNIAGIGLFAAEFVAKDSIIWEYDPIYDKVYTQEEFDNAVDLYKQFLTTYCFRFIDKYYLCIDNARFFNHSDSPNCYSSDFNEMQLGFTRALRDIQPGEELTDDYTGFGFTEKDREWNSINF